MRAETWGTSPKMMPSVSSEPLPGRAPPDLSTAEVVDCTGQYTYLSCESGEYQGEHPPRLAAPAQIP